MNDPALSPAHYADKKIEHWDVVKAWELDYLLGNCTKYISRHKQKGAPLLDIEKSMVYLKKYFADMIAEYWQVCIENGDEKGVLLCMQKSKQWNIPFPPQS